MNKYIYIYVCVRTLDYLSETKKKKRSNMFSILPNNPMFDRIDHIHRRIPTIRLEQHFYYPIQQQNTNTENRTIKCPR
jgi:hypothetical protein